MATILPSMSSLLAFEAAARHLSFTRASIELNITQGAVSQRIKTLEETLGVPLFIRDGNLIRVTAAGYEYLEAARRAITEMLVATDRAVGYQRGDVLTIACLGTFALKCLIPNLKFFREEHPDISLKIRTLVPYGPPTIQHFDVSIQYGVGDWPGYVAMKIAPEEIFPVCSPELAAAGDGLRVPADLSRYTIIRTASPLILRDDWPLWLEEAGIAGLKTSDEIICDLLYPSFQAAIEGLGVALGRTAVVAKDLREGRLVEPFDVRLQSPLGYYVVAAPERAQDVKVEKFTKWVRKYFSETTELRN
ncbi:Glycine cleavage system transcriptional activator GcvA [Agrobacterium deltaense Zutra 3/1]|uniref:Glycine cleavage system transcriptional activator GcvA n=1 Tax=Agrobacterium deltaense Zutra 3/1 TaxID=1183427 RepID=A0A1S7S2Y7_9HYPH|nr:LysR substrate-binding domain-containing protein [Agrobacterium deltaense]CUX61606.1 Glycine cleavage system transcriptional activator GcvA [Agrobacterium deltaense Zutra 3/1]